MITKMYGKFILTCDNCEDIDNLEQTKELFDTFQDAVEAKKERGWVTFNQDEMWLDVCQDCQ